MHKKTKKKCVKDDTKQNYHFFFIIKYGHCKTNATHTQKKNTKKTWNLQTTQQQQTKKTKRKKSNKTICKNTSLDTHLNVCSSITNKLFIYFLFFIFIFSKTQLQILQQT